MPHVYPYLIPVLEGWRPQRLRRGVKSRFSGTYHSEIPRLANCCITNTKTSTRPPKGLAQAGYRISRQVMSLRLTLAHRPVWGENICAVEIHGEPRDFAVDMHNVAVIGGSGFVSSSLVQSLQQDSETLISRESPPPKASL